MNQSKEVQTELSKKLEKQVCKKDNPSNPISLDYETLTLAISNGKKDIVKFLLELNCRVNSSRKETSAHDTPLHFAVKSTDLELVKILLSKKASIEAVNAEGNTPLHLAFLNRQYEIVNILLSHVESIDEFTNSRNPHNLTHLHIACTSTCLPHIVQRYLETGANMDDAVAKDSPVYAGFTAMHFAVEFKSLNAIRTLHACRNFFVDYPEDSCGTTAPQLAYQNLTTLSIACHIFNGGSYDVKNSMSSQLSLFHMACLREDSATVEKFIKNGASVNTPVSSDAVFCPLYTPLHFAVEGNMPENVEMLLKHNADVDKINGYSMTPLHLALYNENYRNKNRIVDVLYAAVKNKTVNRTDINGLSYLHVACSRNDIPTVRALLEKNDKHSCVRPNERNFSYFTPFDFAVSCGHHDLAKFLLDNGATVDWRSLHLACEIGDLSLIELLMERNVNVGFPRVSDGKTALHLLVEAYMDDKDVDQSVYKGDIADTVEGTPRKNKLLKFAKMLILRGCDVNAKDKNGNTALHLACLKIRDGGKCIRKLLNYGADINVENKEGDTPFDRCFNDDNRFQAADYVVFFHHANKLRAVGKKVSEKINKCCVRMLKELRVIGHNAVHTSEILRMQRERNADIARLKSVKLSDLISLYDFMKLDKTRALIFAKDTKLMKIVKDENLKKEFPVFGHLLKMCYKRIENEPCIEYEGKRKLDVSETRSKRRKTVR